MVMDCKLCFKRFSNGKALGAHMRSHYAILPLPPKTPPQRHEQQLTEPPAESTSSVDDKSLLSATSAAGSSEKQHRNKKRKPDPELESESAGSTRPRGGIMNLDDDLQGEVTKKGFAELGMGLMEEDDVALCLIMLSRDVWRNSDDSSRKIFRCEKCYKVFKSSQGLGSHKATHLKKMKNPPSFLEREREREDQVHECALCPRIFKSAQALGGHKRSHFPSAGRNLVVDLNLPAVAVMKM